MNFRFVILPYFNPSSGEKHLTTKNEKCLTLFKIIKISLIPILHNSLIQNYLPPRKYCPIKLIAIAKFEALTSISTLHKYIHMGETEDLIFMSSINSETA